MEPLLHPMNRWPLYPYSRSTCTPVLLDTPVFLVEFTGGGKKLGQFNLMGVGIFQDKKTNASQPLIKETLKTRSFFSVNKKQMKDYQCIRWTAGTSRGISQDVPGNTYVSVCTLDVPGHEDILEIFWDVPGNEKLSVPTMDNWDTLGYPRTSQEMKDQGPECSSACLVTSQECPGTS